MRFSSLPRRARARTWLRTRARFRGLPRSPPGGGQAANERRKTKSRRKSRFSFSFLSIFFFSPPAGSRDQRAAPPRWQRGRRERSRAPTPSPSSPGCRGEPSPLRPPPGTAEAPGARSPTRSRQPPSSRCPPGLRRGFLAFLGSRSRAERETGLGKGEPYKKAATPHVPIPRDPKGKGEGICPAPFPGSLARMGQQLRGKRL